MAGRLEWRRAASEIVSMRQLGEPPSSSALRTARSAFAEGLGCFLACIACSPTRPPATPLAPVTPEASATSDTIRAYEPVTGVFSTKTGELACQKPSVSDWQESATEYKQAVRASIESLRRDFTDCFITQLRENAATSGTSCVRFVVDGEGRVTLVEIASSTLPDALQYCVLISGSRANIPPPKSPPLNIMLPLTFLQKATSDANPPARDRSRSPD
jgi:hypothetical protein